MSPTSTDCQTQRGRLLGLLIGARGAWIPLPRILELGIAQYNSRLLDLRRLGFHIENRREGKRSWFRLIAGPTVPTPAPAAPAPEADSLFPDMRERHVDLG